MPCWRVDVKLFWWSSIWCQFDVNLTSFWRQYEVKSLTSLVWRRIWCQFYIKTFTSKRTLFWHQDIDHEKDFSKKSSKPWPKIDIKYTSTVWHQISHQFNIKTLTSIVWHQIWRQFHIKTLTLKKYFDQKLTSNWHQQFDIKYDVNLTSKHFFFAKLSKP